MSTKPLGDSSIYPTDGVLEKILGKVYPVYEHLIATVTAPEIGLTHEWRYYKDCKSWLCKVSFRKKTVFWLSVRERYFLTGFFFTEKTKPGVLELLIDDNLKSIFKNTVVSGKMIPLSILVTGKKQIRDILVLVKYKIMLK